MCPGEWARGAARSAATRVFGARREQSSCVAAALTSPLHHLSVATRALSSIVAPLSSRVDLGVPWPDPSRCTVPFGLPHPRLEGHLVAACSVCGFGLSPLPSAWCAGTGPAPALPGGQRSRRAHTSRRSYGREGCSTPQGLLAVLRGHMLCPRCRPARAQDPNADPPNRHHTAEFAPSTSSSTAVADSPVPRCLTSSAALRGKTS